MESQHRFRSSDVVKNESQQQQNKKTQKNTNQNKTSYSRSSREGDTCNPVMLKKQLPTGNYRSKMHPTTGRSTNDQWNIITST